MQWTKRMRGSITPLPLLPLNPLKCLPHEKNTHPKIPLFSSSPPPSPPQPLSLLQDFAVQTRNRCLPGPCWKTPLFWMPATCFSFRDEGSQLAFLWSQFQKKGGMEKKLSKCLQVRSKAVHIWAHLCDSVMYRWTRDGLLFVVCGWEGGRSKKKKSWDDEDISRRKST